MLHRVVAVLEEEGVITDTDLQSKLQTQQKEAKFVNLKLEHQLNETKVRK